MFDPSLNRKLSHYDEYIENFDNFSLEEENENANEIEFKLLKENSDNTLLKCNSNNDTDSINRNKNLNKVLKINSHDDLYNVSNKYDKN